MKTSLTLTFACAALIGLVSLAPSAKADDWNKKTTFKFSGPVEIPGQILPAGTYVFKLVDSLSDRHIVRISNEREDHVFATILAIPNYRLQPKGKTILTFEEREAGGPEAIRAWFYPGDNFGDEFVYPKVRAVVLAKQYTQPVPSMPTELAVSTVNNTTESAPAPPPQIRKAPLMTQQPTGEEQVIIATNNAPAPAPVATAPMPQPAPAELPHTGSNIPFMGLMGLCSLALAVSIKVASRSL